VLLWTITNHRPFGVASMPLALNWPCGWNGGGSAIVCEDVASRPRRPIATLYSCAWRESVKYAPLGVS
jgi:hypothetical protein